MAECIIYPAIDLRGGKVVRLKQCSVNHQTVFGDHPAATAHGWITQGAKWLHVVNLDGAFGADTSENKNAVRSILDETKGKVLVQIGGGFRSIAQIRIALDLGVNRIVLGTAVIENPLFGMRAIKEFGADKISFGFDLRNGELMSRGWKYPSGVNADALAKTLSAAGAQTFIYTNIERDGMGTGVDWREAKRLQTEYSVCVIASGGVSSLDHIIRVKAAGLGGVIIGRALYDGKFTLTEALDVC